MLKTYVIHVDTALTSNVNKVNGNSFQCIVPLVNRHRDIKRVWLKSAEIPYSFYNIRAPYNTVVINSTTYTVTPGSYTLTTLLSALNTAVSGIGSFTAPVAPSTKLTFTAASATRTFTTVSAGSIAYLLGFTAGQSAGSGATITATNSYNLSQDTYISIWLKNLYTSSSETPQISFKIPVNSTSGTITFFGDESQFCQYLDITESRPILDRLDIQVNDRFGNLLDNNGVDWSFTIAIETLGT